MAIDDCLEKIESNRHDGQAVSSALPTIADCLRDHQVEIQGSNECVPMYLIEVKTQSSVRRDFIDTFKGIDDFKKKLAEKTLSDKAEEQTYGVLISSDLKYEFAFNRKFADYDSEMKKIVFKQDEDLLLEFSKKDDFSDIEEKVPDFGIFTPNDSISDDDLLNTIIRYAITGKKGDGRKVDCSADFEQKSLLDRVKNEYSKNVSEVQLGGKIQPVYFVEISYNTNTFDDFMQLYKAETDDFEGKLARKLFDKGKQKNQYVMLIDMNMQIIYAFNRKFQAYDESTKTISKTAVEEVLLEHSGSEDLSKSIMRQTKKAATSQPKQGSMVVMYGIVGKNNFKAYQAAP
jgi:hypothetical protein